MMNARWPRWAALGLGTLLLARCTPSSKPEPQPEEELALNVASPRWEDQVIYFVMTDRFNDGDPSNNDQGAGEYDPASNARYSGGDLKGIEAKLDYIKGLGATAVWITPPVANQWWDPLVNYGGYHGYWARNFKEVDAHYGTLADYQSLSSALHRNGMYLIQDIVVNHMANCFTWKGEYDPANPAHNAVLNTGAKPACGPTQAPFSQWNVTLEAHRAASAFHWTPAIRNYQDPVQEQTWQLSDLDDLNTEDPAVVAALKDSYAYWVKTVGVDAFRIDTAFYVPQAFFRDFMHGPGGILEAARSTGREGFLAFGEGFASDKPFEDTQARKIDSYMTDPATGEDLLPSMINFPMYRTSTDVFAKGHPTAELGHRLASMMALHKRPHLMPNFIDNHDVNRYLNGGSEQALQQNLLFMMTIPGIPVIYYGTEQGFTEQRAAMFKGGFGSGGRDHFDTTLASYKYVARITRLRKDHAVFRRGTPTVLRQNGSGPGAFAYRMSDGTDTALVVFNTSDKEALVDNLETGLPAGAELQLLDGLQVGTDTGSAVADQNGRLTLKLPARAARVYRATGSTRPVGNSVTITLELPGGGGTQSGDFTVTGRVSDPSVISVKLVVDGALDTAQSVRVQPDGSFTGTVSVEGMVDRDVVHTVVAYSEWLNVASNSASFTVDRTFSEVLTYPDPALDDVGPKGTYRYPTDTSWGDNHQGDLRTVTLSTAGTSLRIALQMARVTTVWNPQNGFDHVAFSIFIDVPGRTGVTVMPQQNASVPVGMAWDYKARVHGWSNALFSSTGATATRDGEAVSPAAGIEVDAATNTVTLTLSSASLGSPQSLSGAKVYVTTWDYDGGYRELVPAAEQWKFWGGNGAVDPLVLDDTPVLTVP